MSVDLNARFDFYGSREAELFTRECAESLEAVLRKSFTPDFVTTSVDGRVCSDQLWTRDAGVLMRELVKWGRVEPARFLAGLLLDLVDKNRDGYYSFPMHFYRGKRGHGSELDGTCAILIGLRLLWERLDAGDPLRGRITEFVLGEASPVRHVLATLGDSPLIPGSGEFGGGLGIPGEYYNVVQNFLAVLALRSADIMARDEGNSALADDCLAASGKILDNMRRFLVGPDGAWLWAVDTRTCLPDPAIINHESNKGFGGLNGVAAMYADVFGFAYLPEHAWLAETSAKTFDSLLAFPLRRQQFEKYGMWSQFDVLIDGLLTSPAYGQGYALQAALMLDRPETADRLAGYMARATYSPPAEYRIDRESPYYFYERFLSPDFSGLATFDQGCGALNLVNVAEPLKCARLIAGVDDSDPALLRLRPRIPPSWGGYEARNVPVRHNGANYIANINCDARARKLRWTLAPASSDVPARSAQARAPGCSTGLCGRAPRVEVTGFDNQG